MSWLCGLDIRNLIFNFVLPVRFYLYTYTQLRERCARCASCVYIKDARDISEVFWCFILRILFLFIISGVRQRTRSYNGVFVCVCVLFNEMLCKYVAHKQQHSQTENLLDRGSALLAKSGCTGKRRTNIYFVCVYPALNILIINT